MCLCTNIQSHTCLPMYAFIYTGMYACTKVCMSHIYLLALASLSSSSKLSRDSLDRECWGGLPTGYWCAEELFWGVLWQRGGLVAISLRQLTPRLSTILSWSSRAGRQPQINFFNRQDRIKIKTNLIVPKFENKVRARKSR